MKKLLLFGLLAASAFAQVQAQQLKFLYEGEPVPNNFTLIYDKEPEVETFPEIPGYIAVTLDPKIHIESSTDATVTVKATANTNIQLCAGGNCVNGTEITKDAVNLTANTPLNLQLDWQEVTYDGIMPEVPHIEILLEAWYNNDPDNMITMLLKMGTDAGVEFIKAENNNINISGRQLNYNVNKASNLSIYTLTGRVMKSVNVNGTGSINLDALPAGVYLYRLAGQVKSSGKFIIK